MKHRSPEHDHIALERAVAGNQAQHQSREGRIAGFNPIQSTPQRGKQSLSSIPGSLEVRSDHPTDLLWRPSKEAAIPLVLDRNSITPGDCSALAADIGTYLDRAAAVS